MLVPAASPIVCGKCGILRGQTSAGGGEERPGRAGPSWDGGFGGSLTARVTFTSPAAAADGDAASELSLAAAGPARDAEDRLDPRRTALSPQGRRRAGMGAAPSIPGCCAGPLGPR